MPSPSSSPVTSTSEEFHPRNWVPLFRFETPKSIFIDLSPSVIASITTGHAFFPTSTSQNDKQYEWSDGTTTTDTDTSTTTSSSSSVETQAIISSMEEALSSMNEQAVCPKIDIRCPHDATWVHFDRSTRCTRPTDILTLIQASERVLAIISSDKPATLCLREWDSSIDSRMEFRIFINDRNVIAITPRYLSCIFTDTDADSIVLLLCEWYQRKIKHKFILSNYVIDVGVVGRRRRKVRLMDFGPWGQDTNTDSLLFEWDELERKEWMENTGRAQFRSVATVDSAGNGIGSDGIVRPAQSMYDGIPVELRQATAMSELVGFAQRLVRNQAPGQNGDEDDQHEDNVDE